MMNIMIISVSASPSFSPKKIGNSTKVKLNICLKNKPSADDSCLGLTKAPQLSNSELTRFSFMNSREVR